MTIKEDTRLRDFSPWLTGEVVQRLTNAARPLPLAGYPAHYEEWTLRQFGELSDICGDPARIALPNDTAGEVFGRLRWLRDEFKRYADTCEHYAPRLTAKERGAVAGMERLSPTHSMIADCIGWFGLHSTDEALDLHVYDWLIMYRKSCEEVETRRRLSATYQQGGGKHG